MKQSLTPGQMKWLKALKLADIRVDQLSHKASGQALDNLVGMGLAKYFPRVKKWSITKEGTRR